MAVAVYDSFTEWVESVVLPLRQAHPTRKRLDGWDSKSNVEVVARFRHGGSVWQVHGDTHIDPVLRAYEAIVSQAEGEPFVVEPANKRQCLNLKPLLRVHPRYKYFYVYEESSSLSRR